MIEAVHHLINSMRKADIEVFFAPRALERAKDYVQNGAVTCCAFERTDIVSGLVKGSRSEPYAVKVILARVNGRVVIVRTICSCFVQYYCKHAAALLYDAVYQALDDGTTGDLPFKVKEWLSRFERLDEPQARESPDRVLYVLKSGLVGRGSICHLFPQVRVARVLQKGGYGADNRRTDFGLLAHGSAAYIQPDDQAIGRLAVAALLGDSNHFAEQSFQDPELARQLIRRMVETGRCFWLSKDNPALSLGRTREGSVAWMPDSKGNQCAEINFRQGKSEVVLAGGPWYIDTKSWQIGEVKTDIQVDVLSHLLSAPPIRPEHAARVRSSMDSLAKKFSIPLPAADLEHIVCDVSPIPCLTLTARRAAGSGGNALVVAGNADCELITYGVVTFKYGDEIIDCDEKAPTILRLEGNRAIAINRNPGSEAEALKSLSEHGMNRSPRWFSGIVRNEFSLTPDSIHNWLRFTQVALPQLVNEGWDVLLSDSFPYIVVEAGGDWQLRVTQGDSYWFSVELGIEFEGTTLSLLPILAAALHRLHPGVESGDIEKLNIAGKFYAPLPDGRLLGLPFDRVRAILETFIELFNPDLDFEEDKLKISAFDALNIMSLEQRAFIRWIGGERLKRIAKRLKESEGVRNIETPPGFTAELRDYQKTGVSWMQFLREFELGGVLADDMGLGKTVETLAHLLIEKQEGRLDQPALVVCPTSVLPNWMSEAKRLAPDLRVVALHGSERKGLFPLIKDSDIVLTTYALLTRDIKKLRSSKWSVVILDEAQAIKNDETQAARAACALPTTYRLCLTGTPIENHLGELWSLFTFLMPGILGSKHDFKEFIREPVEQCGNATRLMYLIKRIRPFVLRRTKEEVAKELPPKTVMVRHIELEGAQRDLYETVRLAMHKRILEEVAKKGFERSQIVILEALLRLRQACCDPRLVDLEAARPVKESSKLDELLNMIMELLEEGRKILLFSQFTSMLDLIEPELNRLGISFVTLRAMPFT